jgi:hypothetical protein
MLDKIIKEIVKLFSLNLMINFSKNNIEGNNEKKNYSILLGVDHTQRLLEIKDITVGERDIIEFLKEKIYLDLTYNKFIF